MCRLRRSILFASVTTTIQLSPKKPEPLPSRSVSPSPCLFDSPDFKRLLEAATLEGDLSQVDTTLRTWTSTSSSTSPTPKDLGSALDSAVIHGHLSIVRLLLDHGAPITNATAALASRDDKPNTLATYESFLQHGWSAQSTANKDGTMAMSLIMGHPDGESLLQWFLDNGAPPNGLPSDPGSPIRWAVITASSPAIPNFLISRGATLKYTSALYAAAYRSGDDASIVMMKCLLKGGIDINELEFEGWDKLPRGAALKDWGTALYKTAGKKGSVSRTRFLVESGIDLGKKSRNGYTARDTAQLTGNQDVQRYLEAAMRERGMEVTQLELKEEAPKTRTELFRGGCTISEISYPLNLQVS